MSTPSPKPRRRNSANKRPSGAKPHTGHVSDATEPRGVSRPRPMPKDQIAARANAASAHPKEASATPHISTQAPSAVPQRVGQPRPETPKAPASLVGQLRPLLAMDGPLTPSSGSAPSDEGADKDSNFRWMQRVTSPSPRSMNRWPTTALSRAARAGMKVAARSFFRAATITKGNAAEPWACEFLDRSQWPTRPLRVGVADVTLRQALERTTGRCALDWVATPAAHAAHDLFKRHTLDAFIRMDARGGLILSTPEAPRKAAAWHNWSTERPVTFATLFPGRVDCAVLTLPSEASRPGATWFLRSLIEAAATLSRHPARLCSEDRLQGRTPRIDTLRAVDLPPTGDPVRDAQRLVIHALFESMREAMQLTCRPGCVEAARLVSAFVAGADDDLPEASRLEMAEACVTLAPGEAEVQLRLAAVRLASYVDAPALDAILTGERLLRDNQLNGGTTQLPFLQAELEVGRGTPISLGRVAAGVAMVCASLETSRIAFFRDDLLDDARYSDWLIPKDQDRRVLVEVFRAILEEREAAQAGRIAA